MAFRRIRIEHALIAVAASLAIAAALTWNALTSGIGKPILGIPHAATKAIEVRDAETGQLQDTVSWHSYSRLRNVLAPPAVVTAEGLLIADAELRCRDGSARVNVRSVDYAYFDVLGVAFAEGADWAPSGVLAADEIPLVVSASIVASFGSRGTLLGHACSLNGRPTTIVGVSAREFTGTRVGEQEQSWVPLEATTTLSSLGESRLFPADAIAAPFNWLRPIASVGGESAEAFSERLEAVWKGAETVPIFEAAYRPDARSGIRTLLTNLRILVWLAIGLATTNLVWLSAVHALAVRPAISLRRVLGASLFQAIAPYAWSVLLAVLSGAGLGAGAAFWLLKQLQRYELPGSTSAAALPLDIGLDTALWGLAVAVTLWALALLHFVGAAMRPIQQPWSRARQQQPKLMALLVVCQVSVTATVGIAAVVLSMSVRNAYSEDLGFASSETAFFAVRWPERRVEGAQALQLAERLLREFRVVPGVAAASLGRTVHGGDIGMTAFTLTVDRTDQELDVPYLARYVGPDFLQTLGIEVTSGRGLLEADVMSSLPVAVVSQSLAARLWLSATTAVGRTVRLPGDTQELTVVGVAADAVREGIRSDVRPTLYVPVAQHLSSLRSLDFVIRLDGPSEALRPTMERLVRTLEPGADLVRFRTPIDLIARETAPLRLARAFASVLAVITLLVAGCGVFGTAAMAILRREREIAIQLALGARPSRLLRSLTTRHAGLVGIGCALGAAAWVAVRSRFSPLVYGLAVDDRFPVVLGAGLAALSLVVVVSVAAARVFRIRLDGLWQDS